MLLPEPAFATEGGLAWGAATGFPVAASGLSDLDLFLVSVHLLLL